MGCDDSRRKTELIRKSVMTEGAQRRAARALSKFDLYRRNEVKFRVRRGEPTVDETRYCLSNPINRWDLLRITAP